MKYAIKYTSQFCKQLKTVKKSGKQLAKREEVVDLLAGGVPMPPEYKDHALTGNWVNHRECHIEPDWLLIYYKQDDVVVLTLVATGTHADLF